MKTTPMFLLFLSLFLILFSSVVTADPEQDVGAIFKSPPPHPVGTFDDFAVQTTDSVVGQSAGYTFSFLMDPSDFRKLNKGGFAFSFPDGFDLATVEEIVLSHNSEAADYSVEAFETTEDLVVVTLKRIQWNPQDEIEQLVSVSVYLETVGNPEMVGNYQFGGLAFYHTGSVLAGPVVSKTLEIFPSQPVSIEVHPSDDLVLRAGESITFDAIIQDIYGNLIPSSEADWTLNENSDPLGYLTGSTLHVTTVGTGWVRARVDDVVDLSGQITVLPGALASIELDINQDHVVGYPLRPEARLVLLDAFGNLKTDYLLATNPIMLSVGTGNLTPAMIDDVTLLYEGSIDLNAVGIVYDGPTAQTALSVETADGVVSSEREVSFSGYDILVVLGEDDQPLESISPSAGTVVKVVVANNGNLVPAETSVNLMLTCGLSVSMAFEPGAGGRVDTIAIPLTGSTGGFSEDTLIVDLETCFHVGGDTLLTEDRVELAVDIVEPVELTVIPGQFWPDSLYPGAPTSLSLDVMAAEPLEISTDPTFRIVLTNDGGITEVDLAEASGFSSIAGEIIRHTDVPTDVPLADLLPSSWYDVVLDYSFESKGVPYVINHQVIDSVFVLSAIVVSYVEGSFGPAVVNAGSESSFGFTVNLDGDYSVPVDPSGAIIEVFGDDFFSSTLLRIADQTLRPGLNLVTTDPVFIPEGLQGQVLRFDAGFDFMIPGAQVGFEFTTDFSTAAVHVTAAPVVRIVDADIIAPNAPQVNTGQPFQIQARVANISGSLLGPLDMVLRSDVARSLTLWSRWSLFSPMIRPNLFLTLSLLMNRLLWSSSELSSVRPM